MTMKPLKMEGVILTEVDDESILYDSAKGKIHILNEVGATIWKLCDGEHTVEDISAQIESEFNADGETVRKDVKEFLDKMQEIGLIIL